MNKREHKILKFNTSFYVIKREQYFSMRNMNYSRNITSIEVIWLYPLHFKIYIHGSILK